ncbi:peptidoglycan bridge formation glycyltransferase FemA/FemB family protein [Candidatus Uhrbacteria bacterium]|nr:peptidoglycan bridge formation glycyltransferase FemA/FemB family protein [Candidatus Uhrbacteria bacterium]
MSLLQATDERDWDAFILDNGGCFLQSWGWSRFQEAVGRTVYRFRIGRDGRSDVLPDQEDPLVQFSAISHGLRFGFRYSYVPYGPVFRLNQDEREVEECLRTFVAAWREAMGRQGQVFGRADLPWSAREKGPLSPSGIRGLGFRRVEDYQPIDTSVVFLASGEETLLAGMRPKTRYNIRVAQRHGVRIREAERDGDRLSSRDVDAFWDLMGETAGRDGFHTHPRSYYETMLDVLSPGKTNGLSCRLHFAEHQGQAIAAAITAEFGGTVTYLHGASSSGHRNTMAPNLLHWELIRQAKRDGFSRYDFWGIAPVGSGPDHPWSGITRFKVGFGGRTESRIGTWELPYRRFWYGPYRLARRVRDA